MCVYYFAVVDRWVNNCVGVGNHKLFMLFIFYVFITCIYSMVLVTAKYVVCIASPSGSGRGCRGEMDAHLVVVFLLVESILFGLFTLCMLGDQLSSILTNQTQIDRLKNAKFKQQTEVNEVFGSPAHLLCAPDWLYPVQVNFPDALRAGILGYVVGDDHHEGHPTSTAEEELAPLMAAAHASFTSASPLHPNYKPKSDPVILTTRSDHSVGSSSSSGVSKTSASVLNSRKVS